MILHGGGDVIRLIGNTTINFPSIHICHANIMFFTYILCMCQLKDGSTHQGTVTSMEPNEGTFILHGETTKVMLASYSQLLA